MQKATPLNTPESSTQADNSRYALKKRKALDAAAAVFASKGFHGATTQDIAEALGIQQGSLYYYFSSKEEALRQVCEYGFENYVAQMQTIFARAETAPVKLYAVIASHLSRYRQNSNALKVHNDQRLYLPQEKRSRLKELGTEYRQTLEATIRRGLEGGELRQDIDPHFVAYSIIGVCNAWGLNLVRDESLDLYQVIDQCAELLLHGILNNVTQGVE